MARTTRVRVCSALTVESAGRTLTGRDVGSRKARTLLALLVAERDRLVPLDRIVEVLWQATPPADPAANVATLVSRTRRVLGAGVLRASGTAYGIDTSVCTVDLDEARTLVGEAADRLAAGETALAAAAARRALETLGTSPALPDEPDADWVRRVRAEVEELRRHGRHLLAGAATPTDPGEAAAVASAAVATDPYDERAVRDLMRALLAEGSTAAALTAYDDLATRLREDLGIDPAAQTAALHLSILRDEEPPAEDRVTRRTPRRAALVGRESELATMDRSWAAAGAGEGQLVLVDGEGGIGKTRLLDAAAELAESTGGLVLRGRCHPAESSLFLQPYVDALRPVLLGLGVMELGDLLGEHAAPWVALLPELADVVEVDRSPRAAPAIERRRAYDAVAAVLRGLARHRPVLLSIDDLQDGGAASVDLLGYLSARLSRATVLLVGAVRTEDQDTVGRLADRAVRVTLAGLPPAAVEALASAAGLSDHAEEVMTRTAGHSLSVVESLRALAAGDVGVPESLAAAVLARVNRLEPGARDVVQGASVLRSRLEPRMLADLVGLDELAAVRRCEELALVGLLHGVGTHYEFANDLAQECVYVSLPPALAAAYHRRAADLLSGQPESMAAHAFAAGDRERAARGWLLAAEAAMARSAVEDATGLLDRSLAAAEDPSVRARALLARGRANEASTAFAAAHADIGQALALARASGDRRLEMAALRALGGDVPVALRVPMAEMSAHLEAGLHLASGLGDRRAEADFTSRLTVLEASSLRLAAALARADVGLARARASGAQEALPLALDGVKTVLAYLGDGERLREVAAELQELLRERRSTWLLQWAVFESSFSAAGDGDWERARALVEEALEVNRRSGFTAYIGYFRAHLGWFARLTGDLDTALVLGRSALTQTSPVDHPWWYASTTGLLASTFLELGRADEAADLARRGLAGTGPDAPEAWRLLCLAPLAAALDGPAGDEAYAEASRLLENAVCPPGQAWVVGSDCYLQVARAARRRDDPELAVRVLEPLRLAVRERWEPIRLRVDAELGQISSATS